MRLLFPSHPFDPRAVDPAFQAEHDAAVGAGLTAQLLDASALEEGAYGRATRRIPAASDSEPELAVYRGWMISLEAYASLHAALAERGLHLINAPEQYRHTHHLPESYPVVREVTPRSVWTTTGSAFDVDAVMALLHPFGDSPVIVKDYVKSQKHYWKEACFIPSARDAAAVERVVSRFIELQDGNLTGGLVFREFVEIEALTSHSKSGMPLTKEFRRFFLDGTPLFTAQYWEEGEYGDALPPEQLFASIAKRVKSRFFTMDVAERTNGEWIIMELGDAQVAGIPERVSPTDFYRTLATRTIGLTPA